MSGHAYCWATEQFVRPPAAKFLLVMMAEGADMDGVVCSDSLIEHLCAETSQDRNEVLEGIGRLKELGLIEKGTWSSRNGYKFIGMPPEYPETHYVYKLVHRETGEFYIGVRTTIAREIENDDYFGSGSWPRKQRKRHLEKQLLGIYDSREDAEVAEAHQIQLEWNHPLCRNLSNGYTP